MLMILQFRFAPIFLSVIAVDINTYASERDMMKRRVQKKKKVIGFLRFRNPRPVLGRTKIVTVKYQHIV